MSKPADKFQEFPSKTPTPRQQLHIFIASVVPASNCWHILRSHSNATFHSVSTVNLTSTEEIQWNSRCTCRAFLDNGVSVRTLAWSPSAPSSQAYFKLRHISISLCRFRSDAKLRTQAHKIMTTTFWLWPRDSTWKFLSCHLNQRLSPKLD